MILLLIIAMGWMVLGWAFWAFSGEYWFPQWNKMMLIEKRDYVFFVVGGPVAILSYLLHVLIHKIVSE